MALESEIVIEVIGEGVADIGSEKKSNLPHSGPNSGIVPIFVHKLCGKPSSMRIRRRPVAFLVGKGLPKKVQFAKRLAFHAGSGGIVFVVDSEGPPKDLLVKKKAMEDGQGRELPGFPMAIGVAQPCIESWLLAAPDAIRRGIELPATPKVCEEPELLAAPCKDRNYNPKTALAAAAGRGGEVSAAEKDKIASAINDFELLRVRCPLGFAPFADEVVERIRPLFHA